MADGEADLLHRRARLVKGLHSVRDDCGDLRLDGEDAEVRPIGDPPSADRPPRGRQRVGALAEGERVPGSQPDSASITRAASSTEQASTPSNKNGASR